MRGLIVLLSLSLAACSTTPVTQQSAMPVPADRIYAASYVVGNEPAKGATVSFARDSGFLGGGCSHDLYVNNAKVFAIRPGELITLNLSPGPYFFRLETGGGLCPNVATSQNTNLPQGGREVYRILIPSDGMLRMTRVE